MSIPIPEVQLFYLQVDLLICLSKKKSLFKQASVQKKSEI